MHREQAKDFAIQRLGECTITSPMSGVRFTNDEEHILLHSDLNKIRHYLDTGGVPPRFEMAGPREKISMANYCKEKEYHETTQE